MRVIDFVPPVIGIEGEFNTLRLGLFYMKRLKIGDRIALLDSKDKMIIGFADVTKLYNGPLGELCMEHAPQNHTQKSEPETQAPANLLRIIQKFYGPHIATYDKKGVVIYLRRVDESAISNIET